MTDQSELVGKLRHEALRLGIQGLSTSGVHDDATLNDSDLLSQAADEIQRLTAERDEVLGLGVKEWVDMRTRAQSTEARLTKMVEALEKIGKLSENAAPDSGTRDGTFNDGVTIGWNDAARIAASALSSVGGEGCSSNED